MEMYGKLVLLHIGYFLLSTGKLGLPHIGLSFIFNCMEIIFLHLGYFLSLSGFI
jgi:hypothetical protein